MKYETIPAQRPTVSRSTPYVSFNPRVLYINDTAGKMIPDKMSILFQRGLTGDSFALVPCKEGLPGSYKPTRRANVKRITVGYPPTLRDDLSGRRFIARPFKGGGLYFTFDDEIIGIEEGKSVE